MALERLRTGTPPIQPYVSVSMVDIRGLAVGAMITNPEVATLTVRLADGTSVQERAVNASMLVFVPYHGPAAWSDLGTAIFADASGRELVSGQIWVSPYPSAGNFGTTSAERDN